MRQFQLEAEVVTSLSGVPDSEVSEFLEVYAPEILLLGKDYAISLATREKFFSQTPPEGAQSVKAF